MKIPKIKSLRQKSAPTPRRRLTDRENPPLNADTATPVNFRRNSTITGSRSNSVRSASELGGKLQSPRAQAHHLRRRQRSLSALFAGSMIAVVGLVIIIYQFTANVSTSIYGQIGATSAVDTTQYNDGVQQYLNTRPLERIRLLLNQDRLASYLQQIGYSEVSAIQSVVPDGFGRAHLKLKVREPVASWTIEDNKRYVDRAGTIFTYNYYPEPTVKIVDKSGVDIAGSSNNVTSSRFLVFVGQAVGFLKDRNIDVRQVVIPSTGTRQVEFVVGSSNDNIKMTIDRPVGEQAEDAAVAWQYLVEADKSIRYIDVRVSGQAYYR